MSEPVRRALVHGGGVAAPMTALAIAKAYGRLGVEVVWRDDGARPAPHDALVAPPDLATLHRLLGIDDRALARGAAATFNLGQQFAGWSGDEGAFLHAYGDAGTPYASLPFVQHWIRARAAGLRVALEDFCLAAAAAKQGRIGEGRGEARQAVKHGWHLDAAGYAALLRAGCESAGVRIVDGDAAVEADLIIDADGALIAAADGGGTTRSAPVCDRLLRGTGPAFAPLPLYSRVTAHSAGWLTLIPLADRTAAEFAYAGAYMSDDAARVTLAAMTGGRLDIADAAETLTGKKRRPFWSGQIVAIGPAAGEAPPLDGADLLLLQLAIAQLILLWPIDRAAMPEADIYNQEMAGTWARVGDFTAQHFRLNARSDPFWQAARAAPVSPELAAKVDLFAARGLFAHGNHEAHVEDSWALVMTGHGVIPRSFDPQAAGVNEPSLMAEFQRQLRAVAASVNAMEPHADALRRLGR